MKQHTISGQVSRPVYEAFKALKQELDIKTHGKLIAMLLLSYRHSKAILNGDTMEDPQIPEPALIIPIGDILCELEDQIWDL